MPVIAVLAAVLSVVLEQLVQGQYGVVGLTGLTLFTVGCKAHNVACSSIGAAMLAFLIAVPAL